MDANDLSVFLTGPAENCLDIQESVVQHAKRPTAKVDFEENPTIPIQRNTNFENRPVPYKKIRTEESDDKTGQIQTRTENLKTEETSISPVLKNRRQRRANLSLVNQTGLHTEGSLIESKTKELPSSNFSHLQSQILSTKERGAVFG
jgi:hypothetical protein